MNLNTLKFPGESFSIIICFSRASRFRALTSLSLMTANADADSRQPSSWNTGRCKAIDELAVTVCDYGQDCSDNLLLFLVCTVTPFSSVSQEPCIIVRANQENPSRMANLQPYEKNEIILNRSHYGTASASSGLLWPIILPKPRM